MLKNKTKIGAAVLAAGLLLAVAASMAIAAETSRDEYKAAVEPICKKNVEANSRILKGVRQEVRKGELKKAAGQFAKAAAALQKAYRELSAVPKPAADETRLNKWLGYIKTEVHYLQEAAKALKAGDKRKLPKLQVQLERYIRLANNEVLPFDFRYCKSKPASSYT